MKLFEGYKNTLLVLITPLIFGYMLGLTISSVVDYRLRDAIINIPRPRNNIVVKLDDLKIKTNRVKEHFTSSLNEKKNEKKKKNKTLKSDKFEIKAKKIIEKKTQKKMKAKKIIEKKTQKKMKAKKIIEKKTQKNKETQHKNKKKAKKNNEEPGIEQFTNLWDSDKIHDQALTMYSNNYNKNNKKIKNNKSFLNAANQEDTDQLYQSVTI